MKWSGKASLSRQALGSLAHSFVGISPSRCPSPPLALGIHVFMNKAKIPVFVELRSEWREQKTTSEDSELAWTQWAG